MRLDPLKLLQQQTLARMRKKHDKDENEDDQEAGVDSIFFGQIEMTQEQAEITALDIAIIGYWRMNKER